VRESRAKRLLIVVGLLLGALLCEGAIRVYDAARGRSSHARAFWYWLYEQDAYLGWRGRPNARLVTDLDDIRHNEDGHRDDRSLAGFARLAPGHRLILCVGESSTYGVSAGTNDRTYPASLERALRELTGGDAWHVYNAGMPGYTSHEVLEQLDLQLLRARPEIIVEMNLANDHDFMGRYIDETTDYNHLPIRLAQVSRSPARDLLMRSSLYALLVSRLSLRYGDDLGSRQLDPPYERATARGLKFYQDNLAMTALLARRSGATLMLVDQPIDYTGLPPVEVASYESMREALRQVAAGERLPLLAAQSKLDWTGLRIHQGVHLGANGYERLAKLLAPQILSAAAPRTSN